MRTFDTRQDMIQDLVKPGMIGCEIGVFEGTFSRSLLGLQPSRLYLVDTFEGKNYLSGDHDGNHLKTVDLEKTYLHLLHELSSDPRVILYRGKSHEFLEMMPDQSLDYIYIDGDHTYAGVRSDLEWAMKKVKKGGLIMGHDFDTNPDKCSTNYDWSQLRAAVLETCYQFGVQLHAIARDGCVSYAIVL